ncbi:MAG: hypothetical protein JWM80_6484 [Cyanobacteria bacterium RYN_339]|nr:hypothetical protein [Cyanobacteria bacterium RYN_339]
MRVSYNADLEAIYNRLRQGDLGNATDDIASLAAELEEAHTVIAEFRVEMDELLNANSGFKDGIDDIARLLGHDSDYGDVAKALHWVKALHEKAADQEVAIRGALVRPKSDEAVRLLSDCLRRYKRP